MTLTEDQILLILKRLKWEPLYQDATHILCRKRGIGYSEEKEIAALEMQLSMMLEVRRRVEGK